MQISLTFMRMIAPGLPLIKRLRSPWKWALRDEGRNVSHESVQLVREVGSSCFTLSLCLRVVHWCCLKIIQWNCKANHRYYRVSKSHLSLVDFAYFQFVIHGISRSLCQVFSLPSLFICNLVSFSLQLSNIPSTGPITWDISCWFVSIIFHVAALDNT